MVSELYEQSPVDLPAREIVGDGILMVGNVSNPIVGVDIADAEDVETVKT